LETTEVPVERKFSLCSFVPEVLGQLMSLLQQHRSFHIVQLYYVLALCDQSIGIRVLFFLSFFLYMFEIK